MSNTEERSRLIAAAKTWLEANTSIRWAREPEFGIYDEERNRRPQQMAERMTDFALEQNKDLITENERLRVEVGDIPNPYKCLDCRVIFPAELGEVDGYDGERLVCPVCDCGNLARYGGEKA